MGGGTAGRAPTLVDIRWPPVAPGAGETTRSRRPGSDSGDADTGSIARGTTSRACPSRVAGSRLRKVRGRQPRGEPAESANGLLPRVARRATALRSRLGMVALVMPGARPVPPLCPGGCLASGRPKRTLRRRAGIRGTVDSPYLHISSRRRFVSRLSARLPLHALRCPGFPVARGRSPHRAAVPTRGADQPVFLRPPAMPLTVRRTARSRSSEAGSARRRRRRSTWTKERGST